MNIRRNTAFILFLLATIAVFLPHFLNPVGELDGNWTLSPAFSALSGNFEFNYYTGEHHKTLYWAIAYPLLLLYKGNLAVHLFYFIIFLAFIAILWKNKVQGLGGLLVALILLTDPLLTTERPEAFFILLIFPFATRVIAFAKNHLNIALIILILLIILLIVLHLANALLTIAGLLVIYGLLFRKEDHRKYFILWGIAITIAVAQVYANYDNPESYYVQSLIGKWQSIGLDDLVEFMMFSGLSLIALLWAFRSMLRKPFLINYALFLVFIFLLQTTYYYLFLFAPFIVALIKDEYKPAYAPFMWIPLTFNVFVSIVHPLYAHFENEEYSLTSKKILQEVEQIARTTHSAVYMENYYALPAMREAPEMTHMLLMDGGHHYLYGDPGPGDQVLSTFAPKNTTLEKILNIKGLSYEKREMLAPVRGKLSLRSLYNHRTDSLGLWIYTVK